MTVNSLNIPHLLCLAGLYHLMQAVHGAETWAVRICRGYKLSVQAEQEPVRKPAVADPDFVYVAVEPKDGMFVS
ncbi:hypothetical protein ECLT68_0577 [Escherichia coli LT-68]|nr:hypothetical protein ECLT68_0577 [Escherichia coli LT-68]